MKQHDGGFIEYTHDELLYRIAGDQASSKAKASLIVLYSHQRVDQGLNRVLYHQIRSRLPYPPDFDWPKNGKEEKKLTRKQWDKRIRKMDERIYEALLRQTFHAKVDLVMTGMKDWYFLKKQSFDMINRVRNSIAHGRAITGIRYRNHSITSEYGLSLYHEDCLDLRLGLDDYLEKMIFPEIRIDWAASYFITKVYGVHPFEIWKFVLSECEKRGIEFPKDPIMNNYNVNI